MECRRIVYLRANARNLAARVSMKGRVVLGLFLLPAVLMPIYTAITEKDSSLHLKVQHGFHSARVSVWVDGDLAYSGSVTGSAKEIRFPPN